jgi:ABC-type bacteriocin/lantibiotic exporter with double-glycine peptidase domain
MILVALGEMISVALIIPLFQSKSLLKISDFFSVDFNEAFYIASIAVLLAYLIKSIVIYLSQRFINKFCFEFQHKIGLIIIYKILEGEFAKVRNLNHNEWLSLLTIESIHIKDTLLLIMLFASEIVVVIFLAAASLYFVPLETSIIILVFLLGFCFYISIFQSQASYNGEKRKDSDYHRIKYLNLAIKSLLDLHAFGVSRKIKHLYEKFSEDAKQAGANQATLNQLPRQVFEFLAVLSVILIITINSYNYSSSQLSDTIARFAFIAAVAFRLLPSINRIVGSIQGIIYGAPNIKHIKSLLIDKEFKKIKKVDYINYSNKKNNYENIKNISILNFEKKINRNLIFKGKKCEFHKGVFTGIIGESGAGKSTFVECLIGLQKFDKGKFYLNKKITIKPLISKTNIVGYVPQEVVLIEGSLLENIIFFRNYDESRLNTLLNSKLASWIYDLPNGLYTQLGNKGMSLSGGQKQRLGILRALFKFPQILIIDETFSGLDKQSISNVLSSLEEFKSDLIVLIISHQLEVIEKCDKIIEISQKTVVERY